MYFLIKCIVACGIYRRSLYVFMWWMYEYAYKERKLKQAPKNKQESIKKSWTAEPTNKRSTTKTITKKMISNMTHSHQQQNATQPLFPFYSLHLPTHSNKFMGKKITRLRIFAIYKSIHINRERKTERDCIASEKC